MHIKLSLQIYFMLYCNEYNFERRTELRGSSLAPIGKLPWSIVIHRMGNSLFTLSNDFFCPCTFTSAFRTLVLLLHMILLLRNAWSLLKLIASRAPVVWILRRHLLIYNTHQLLKSDRHSDRCLYCYTVSWHNCL